MHSRHAEGTETVKIYFMPDVSTKLTLGVMGLKITTLSQGPVDHVPIVK